jgi:hypothetical protein
MAFSGAGYSGEVLVLKTSTNIPYCSLREMGFRGLLLANII